MKKIKINENNIFYKHYSSENSKGTFLILHGRGGSSESWEKVAGMLNKDGYEVFVPDLPGFGETKIDKIYDVENYAEVVENFVNKLKLKNIFLLGHSNGGRISILLENRGKIGIKKLFLNNAAGIKHEPNLKQKISGIMAKCLKLFSWMPGYNFVRKVLYKLVGGHDYLNVKNEKIKQTFLNMIKSDLKTEISKIKSSTVLIWGEKDTYTPVGDGKTIHKLIKGSKLEILNNEKHGIHLQNPVRLFDTIKKYL